MTWYETSQRWPPRARYGLAVVLVAIAGGCNYLMPPVYGESHYYFFSAAILGTALYAGLGPGLLATALSALASAYLFIAPFHTFRIEASEAMERLAMFLVEGAVISSVGHLIRENRTPELDSKWRRYLSAALLVAGATVLKILVFPSLQRHLPFTFYYSAVVAATWVGGAGPGFGAIVLSATCAYFLFFRFGAFPTQADPGLMLFALDATGICLLTGIFRQRLLKSEVCLAHVFQDSPAGILVLDGSAKILKANPAFEQLLHTNPGGLAGRPFLELVDASSHERTHEFLARLNEQEMAYSEEIELVHAGTTAWVVIRGSPMRRISHNLLCCMLLAEDVTELRKAEEALRRLEVRLERAQRVEALGLFAGGIAHDFNNLLVIIFGSCDKLLSFKELPEEARAYAGEILDTAKAAAALTRQLLDFARRQPRSDQIQAVDLNRFITESIGLLQRLLGSRIVLQLELAPDVGQVRADPSQLQQVLMNLAANARDAMQFGGKLRINTSMMEFAASGTDISEIPPGLYVALQVADTGHGMDEATRARIFEPLFSTKDIEKGSGLGLATVQSIVKKFGGSIRVESSPGNGARFWIYLPSVDLQQTSQLKGTTNPESP